MNEPTPYVIHELTPRQTGFPVQVVNLEHPEADRKKPKGDENKYGVICKRHKKMVTAPKRREAHALSRVPVEWCGRCHPKDAEQTPAEKDYDKRLASVAEFVAKPEKKR